MPDKKIVVLDYGGREALRVARMIRGAGVYCEVWPASTPISRIRERKPQGIVAIGGTHDVDENAPRFEPALFALAVPILTMGYGTRAMCQACGGEMEGRGFVSVPKKVPLPDLPLFEGMQGGARMIDRADRLTVPKGFSVLSAVEGVVMILTNDSFKCFGVQFTPESNDLDCQQLLSNFARKICACEPVWSMEAFLEETVAGIRSRVGGGQALLVLTGGVDSSVCAALMHRAIGDRLHCLLVDTGLLRNGEVEKVCAQLRPFVGELSPIDISDKVEASLIGVTDPVRKRNAIDEAWAEAVRDAADRLGQMDFHVRATIYPDVIDAFSGMKERQERLDSLISFQEVLEPLRQLFKDEVRSLGALLGLPEAIITRPQFPRHGLAVRCIGGVTAEKLAILRQADDLFRDAIREAKLHDSLSQYFVVLADMPGESGGYLAILRAMRRYGTNEYATERLPYDFLETLEERVLTQIPKIRRLLVDLTHSRHAPVEWE